METKKNVKSMVSILIVILMVLSVASCKNEIPNEPAETTVEDQAALEEGMEKNGYDDNKIRKAFFSTTASGNYRKNVKKNPVVYWGVVDMLTGSEIENIILPVDEYFRTAKGLPVKPEFKYKTEAKYYVSNEYNSISDKSLASLYGTVSNDFGGRILLNYPNGENIQTFQIELSKAHDYTLDEWHYIVLHEMGHAFGLKDITEKKLMKQTVMYYNMDGFDKKAPLGYYTLDARALSLLYN